MGTEIVKYGRWTPESMAAESADLAKSSSGDFWKPADGRNLVRFLPPRPGKDTPFVRVWQHFYTKPGEQKGTSVVCPRQMKKLPCPICEFIDALRKTGVAADRDVAGKMAAKLRVFACIIDRANIEAGPQKFAFGKTVYDPLLALARDEETGGDFTLPDTGYDIVIEKSGSMMDTKYSVRPARHQSPLGDLGWIDIQPDLDQYALVRSASEIREMLGIDDPADMARPVGPPARRLGAAPSRPAAPNTAVRRTAQDLANEDQD
jgi:hypothetical protein